MCVCVCVLIMNNPPRNTVSVVELTGKIAVLYNACYFQSDFATQIA